jgi:hypothetical protein
MFWDLMPYNLEEIYSHFGGPFYPLSKLRQHGDAFRNTLAKSLSQKLKVSHRSKYGSKYCHDLVCVTYRRGMDWILDLLSPLGTTSNYNAIAKLHKSNSP